MQQTAYNKRTLRNSNEWIELQQAAWMSTPDNELEDRDMDRSRIVTIEIAETKKTVADYLLCAWQSQS